MKKAKVFKCPACGKKLAMTKRKTKKKDDKKK